MNEIEKLIEQLEEKQNEFVKKNIDYKENKATLMLTTDFAEVLNKSRPTVDDKKAYIDLQTLQDKKIIDLLDNEIKILKLKIEFYMKLLDE